MVTQQLNIAGYKFVVLPDRNALRQPFKQRCDELGLKGTILLSYEGINIFVAGPEHQINEFRAFLADDERFADIDFKESYSEHQPFNRMNVRLKNEIISVGMPNFDRTEPEDGRIQPKELHEKLINDEKIVLLDTRNTYETRLGTFQDAIELDLSAKRCPMASYLRIRWLPLRIPDRPGPGRVPWPAPTRGLHPAAPTYRHPAVCGSGRSFGCSGVFPARSWPCRADRPPCPIGPRTCRTRF